MNTDLARYDDVLHAVYDAAVFPERWPQTVRALAELAGASKALLFSYEHAPAQGGFAFAHNISQAMIERWAAKSRHEDPFVRAAVRRGEMVEGNALLGDELVPRDELVRLPFYRELWVPSDIGGTCSGVVFTATDAHTLPTVFAIYHGLVEPPFARPHLEWMRRIVAHLSRALGVMFHLRDGKLQVASSLAALDQLPAGVLLLDADARLQHANRAGLEILSQAKILRVQSATSAKVPGGLQLDAHLASFEAALQRAIASSLASWRTAVLDQFSQPLVLPGADGRPRCVVHVAPISPGAFGTQPRAVLFIYDLENAASLAPEMLCELFGTTQAESRAALQVLQGGSAKAMAARLGISVNTFNTQLKMVYAKIGTHRQADLMKLLLALASTEHR